MLQFAYQKILHYLKQETSATGIGVFRVLYGLVTLQEIVFLFYFRHLIFDPIPYLDVEFPAIPMFLLLWGLVAICLTVSYRYQFSCIANYVFWLIFVNFTSMQRDFDGGFDTYMIGVGFFLLFMPGDRAFSIDNLRRKLSNPFKHYQDYPAVKVTQLAYLLPTWICLGFLYFDSDIHKFFAPQWRHGLGSWLPATQPYYVSALDTSNLLNLVWLQKTVGYAIMLFQLTFLFCFAHQRLRVIYLFFGMAMHLGITLTLNIYPFGLGMLAFYALLVPVNWWQTIGGWLRVKQPRLTVFYDQQCPLCNRTVLILNHFDIFRRIEFKSAQDHALQHPQLAALGMSRLLTDLYAIDNQKRVYSGVETYQQILLKMGYLAPVGLILGLPCMRPWAKQKYRKIADNRARITCDASCLTYPPLPDNTFYRKIFETFAATKPKTLAIKLAKIVIAFIILQINSTLHYGIFYRLPQLSLSPAIDQPISQASNALLMVSSTFLGITPHALYVHDHFADYDRILAITYLDADGTEHWLPFVNPQGRLIAPNWGRVHSMWANIAITPTINNARLRKFVMKVTAFWGTKIGLDLNQAKFNIKMKKIESPTEWVHDQLHKNISGQWLNIGSVEWRNAEIHYSLPDDINAL